MFPHSLRFASRLRLVGLILLVPVVAQAQAPPIDPIGLPGPLIIASEGDIPSDARDAFFTLAGKDKAKIVVIPTAAKNADDKSITKLVESWKDMKPASVKVLHTRLKKEADDPDFVKPLTEATGVWLANGNPDSFLEAYRGTLVEKELRKLHERKAIIGGTIGGMMALTDIHIDGDAPKTAPGLGFLKGFILDGGLRIKSTIAANPTYVGLGFPENAALIIQHGRLGRVFGDGTMTIHIAKGAGKPAANDKYEAGSLIDLVQLQRAAANRAAKTPFPPAKPPEAVVPKGTLMIIGGGGSMPEMWERFIKASGGPDALIVVIPTALEDPLPESVGEEAVLKKFGAKNVKSLHTRDPKVADDPKFSDMLLKAGGVWFGGGRQWRFVDAYGGTLTEKRIHEVLERGGAIGGSSAGASIQSEYMPRGHPLGNQVMAAEGYEKGFGFLPGCAVDQHFFARKRTGDMTGLMKKYPQYLGIGLDESTAIVVTGSTAEVIGRSKVAFYNTTKKYDGDDDFDTLKSGEKYDLKKREKIEK